MQSAVPEPDFELRLQAEEELDPVEVVRVKADKFTGGPHWIRREEPPGDSRIEGSRRSRTP